MLTDRVNSAFVEGISDRNYLGLYFYHFGGLLLNDDSSSESLVHPVLDYNYVFGQPVLGGELSFNVNAASQSQDLEFQEIREGQAIYYIAEFKFINEEWRFFEVDFRPEGAEESYTYKFKHQLYIN